MYCVIVNDGGLRYKNKMLNGSDDDSTEKCRDRRRRRTEMRRISVINVVGSSSSTVPSNNKEYPGESSSFLHSEEMVQTHSGGSYGEDAEASGAMLAAATTLANWSDFTDVIPVYGKMSVAGRLRKMEDAICIQTNLCRPAINHQRPVHFFGVYDGHGGPHVAFLCRNLMHVLMEDELMRVVVTDESERGGSSLTGKQQDLGQGFEEAERGWRRAMTRCFRRMDEVVLDTCGCGSSISLCGCNPSTIALSGSTAVVAVVTAEHIVVANCGDSRAVLCRAGKAIPLSVDQKPDREDEYARIHACGGRVIYLDGPRVEGVLAMSRAIGDKYLKPSVISEPEISFRKREAEDECLILASDGLWDVMSSDLACEIASECLREENPPDSPGNQSSEPQIEDEETVALYPSRSASAAALLTRLALGRKSSDNVSVIVVDLRS